MKRLFLILALAAPLFAQTTIRWRATTGDVSLSGSAYSATVQQPTVASLSGSAAYLDQVQVYCSVACSVTQAVNGAAATSTAGTFQALLPTPLNAAVPLTFWTASNVGAGTDQAGITHVPAGGTVILCFTASCGNPAQFIVGPGSGTASNYSVTIAAGVTGTVNITVFGRTVS